MYIYYLLDYCPIQVIICVSYIKGKGGNGNAYYLRRLLCKLYLVGESTQLSRM